MNFNDYSSEEKGADLAVDIALPEKLPFGLGRVAWTLIAILVCVFLWASISCMWDLSRSSWPTTTGHIIGAQEPPAPRRVDKGLNVDYTYEVGSEVFSGQTFFAPGPERPALGSFSKGKGAVVYYNSILHSVSTLAPDSQFRMYLVYMVFSALAAGAVFFVRPDLNGGREMRAQLPEFLDSFASLLEKGESVPAAMEKTIKERAGRIPNLSLQIEKCLISLRTNQVPLHTTLAQLGTAYKVEEMNNLASTIAAAEMTNSSLVYQIRQQSGALKYRLKAEQLAQMNASNNFAGRRGSRGAMKPEDILESLNRERDES